ncbi:hypothetical protein REPUB_Repub19eG0037900 [Reevesia pubescens]
MGDSREDRKKWQEDMYWTRFQYMHFFYRLSPGFHDQLAIPNKFANKLRNKLPEIVALRGPSGVAWTVELSSTVDGMFFKNGWPKFVKDHSLEEKDLLIFRFNGESSFDVLIFDPSTLCEKEALYFVQRGGEAAGESKNRRKRKMKETYVEVESSQDDDDGCASSVEKSGNEDSFITPSEKSASDNSIYRVRSRSRHCAKSHASSKKIRREVNDTKPAPSRRAKAKSNAKRRPGEKSGVKLNYPSNRRHVSEKQKKDALVAANEEATPDSQVVVMKSRHVDRGMRRKWVAKHLSPNTKQLILRMNERKCLIRFYYHKTNKTGELTFGWKDFAYKNHLKEFDVCVFTPSGRSKDGTLILDVSIFPVVKVEVQPSVHGFTSSP